MGNRRRGSILAICKQNKKNRLSGGRLSGRPLCCLVAVLETTLVPLWAGPLLWASVFSSIKWVTLAIC